MRIFCDCCGFDEVANKGDVCMGCIMYGCDPEDETQTMCQYTLYTF